MGLPFQLVVLATREKITANIREVTCHDKGEGEVGLKGRVRFIRFVGWEF